MNSIAYDYVESDNGICYTINSEGFKCNLKC